MSISQWWVSLSIKARLLTSMLLATVVTVASLLLLSSHQTKSLLEAELHSHVLPNVVGKIGAEIDATIAGPLMLASSLGSNAFVADWLAAQDAQPEELKRYLSGLQQQFELASIFLVRADNQTIHMLSANQWFDKTLQPGMGNDDWYFEFVNSGLDYELNFDVSEDWGAQLFINVRTQERGHLTAVNGVGFSLKSLSENIAQYRIGEKGLAYLVDKNGQVMMHPDDRLVQKPLEQLVGASISQQLPQKGEPLKVHEFKRGADNYWLLLIILSRLTLI